MLAYLSFNKVITLKEMCRQTLVPGDIDQAQFLQALQAIRDGRCSVEHWRFLSTISPQRIGNFKNNFINSIHIYSTNEKVKERNQHKLRELNKPIVCIKAKNNPSSARQLSSDCFRGLENEIFLSVEAHVTLTTNINPQCRLTNGVKGIIKNIVYQKGNRPNIDLPSFVVVHFPDFIGPQFFCQAAYNNYLPIAPISTSSDDFRFKRTQLPLRLSYALTIHKSQGQTLEQAVVDLGSKELTAGLTFVALSRVRHINNLAIFDFPYDRFKKIENSSLLKRRLEEEKRYEELSKKTIDEWENRMNES